MQCVAQICPQGALIRGILPKREGRGHSLGSQFRSWPRCCARSREGAFYWAKATPSPNLSRYCGDNFAHQRQCVFQSGPQASCITPEQDSQSRDWQAPGGNGCVTPEQGSQSNESQAPASNGWFTPAQGRQSRGSQAPVGDRSQTLRARSRTENPPAARPDECGRCNSRAATVARSCRGKTGDPADPATQV